MISLKNLSTNARELFPVDFFIGNQHTVSGSVIEYQGNRYDAADIIDTNRASASLGGIPSTGTGTGTSGPISANDVIETSQKVFVSENTRKNLLDLEPLLPYLLALRNTNTGNETRESIEALFGGAILTALEIAAAYIEKDPLTGKLPAKYWPSALDDVLVFNTLSAFPFSGELGKFYLAQDSNKFYYWTGTVYSSLEAGVSSFNGRFGSVMPSASDYTTALVNPAGDRQYITAQLLANLNAADWAKLLDATLLTLGTLTPAMLDSKLRDLSQVASASLAAKMIGYIPANDTYAVKTGQLGAANGVATLDSAGQLQQLNMWQKLAAQYDIFEREHFAHTYGAAVPRCPLLSMFGATGTARYTNETYSFNLKKGWLLYMPAKTAIDWILQGDINTGDIYWILKNNPTNAAAYTQDSSIFKIGTGNNWLQIDSTGYSMRNSSGSIMWSSAPILSKEYWFFTILNSSKTLRLSKHTGEIIFQTNFESESFGVFARLSRTAVDTAAAYAPIQLCDLAIGVKYPEISAVFESMTL